jgi:hypothetical protein
LTQEEIMRAALRGDIRARLIQIDGTAAELPLAWWGGRIDWVTSRIRPPQTATFSRDQTTWSCPRGGAVELDLDSVRDHFGLMPTPRGGRPLKYDWERAQIDLFGRVYRGDTPEPRTQAEVERMLAQWFVDHGGKQPAESEIRKRSKKLFEAIQA